MGCIISKKEKSLYLNNSTNYSSSGDTRKMLIHCHSTDKFLGKSEISSVMDLIKLSDDCNRVDIVHDSIVVQSFEGPFGDKEILNIDSI